MIVYYTVPAGVVQYFILPLPPFVQNSAEHICLCQGRIQLAFYETNSVLIAALRGMHTIGMVCHTTSLIDYISRLCLIVHSPAGT